MLPKSLVAYDREVYDREVIAECFMIVKLFHVSRKFKNSLMNKITHIIIFKVWQL